MSRTLKDTFLKALEAYKEKDYKKSEIACYKILSIDPNYFDSLTLLANIFAVQRNFNKALEFLKKAHEVQPQNASIINNLGTAYKQLGKMKEAISFYEKALIINPNHVNANYNIGLIYYNLGLIKKSKTYLQKTIKIQNNYALAFLALANAHVELKELREAVDCYKKTIQINPDLVMAHNNLGLVYRDLNDYKSSIECHKNTIQINPKHAIAHYNLGISYTELGDFDEALKYHQMAANLQPNDLIHYFFISLLKKEVLNAKLKEKIEKILKDKKTSTSNLAYGYFLLSKYELKLKNYKNELDFLIKGHKNFYNTKKNTFDQNNRYCFKDVLQITEGAEIENPTENSSYKMRPIFIMGVPRSGSTLIERIIISGKNSIACGEETSILGNFVNKKILEKKSLNLGNAESIRKELFQIYEEKGLISDKKNFTFTDKTLNNFFYLNLIYQIWPNAKIVYCKRNILSSIISIFQNNLSVLSWAHDLDNIFKYFDSCFKIIDNYKKSNPDTIYEIEYEKLINDPKNESKKLMNYCGLPWAESCLKFYKQKEIFSKTASNAQVRKAIYKDSLNKYLPYKKYLKKFGEKYSWFK